MKCDDNDSTAPTSLAPCLMAERKNQFYRNRRKKARNEVQSWR